MKLYVLPTREMVFQPDVTIPMYLENMTSVRAVDACIAASKDQLKQMIMVPQRNWSYPTDRKDLYDTGTLANVLQILRMPDNTIQAMMQTVKAVRLSDIQVNDGIFSAEHAAIRQIDDSRDEIALGIRDAIMDSIAMMARSKRIDVQKLKLVVNGYPLNAFIDAIIHAVGIETADAVQILGKATYFEKLTMLLEKIKMQIQLSSIENDISKRVNSALANGQREMFLRERLSAIQKELGESDDNETKSLAIRVKECAMPQAAKIKAEDELKRMRNMSPMSSESGMIRTYLEELIAMPWQKSDDAKIDLDAARAVLDADHYGMDAVKERILEHLAVMKKTGASKGTIICLVGKPGVGKTSLGKSIADALGRKYQRISLGGVSDEAHFRGHRRTYVGSQSGRIMDALKRAGANNPVILLDEIDKMGRDWHGDPESALLEILDPEQNKTFRDHYLDVDFDLSNIMFIATANSLKMSPALLDRMEIIEMPNYTVDEKIQIARRHLLKHAAADTGWNPDNITIGDDTIKHIINNYTNEPGVRNLRRELTALLRRALYKTKCEQDSFDFTTQSVHDLLNNIRPETARRIGFRTILPEVRL